MLANFTEESLTIPKATVLGVAADVSESLVDSINTPNKCSPSSPTKSPRVGKNDALYGKLLRGKLDHIKSEDMQYIEPVLRQYSRVFHDENVNDYKGTHVAEHQILVGDTKPKRNPP
jgi:hypothetical protein